MKCLAVFFVLLITGCTFQYRSIPALPDSPNELKEEIAALEAEIKICEKKVVVAEEALNKAYENERGLPWYGTSHVNNATLSLRWAQSDLEFAEKRLARAKQRLENIEE